MFSHLPDTIVFVRHPECVHNLGFVRYTEEVRKGLHNKLSPPTERGEIQTVYTAEYLRRVFGTFDITVASDFIRTHAIPHELGDTYIIDPRIGERWQGELHERGNVFLLIFPKKGNSTCTIITITVLRVVRIVPMLRRVYSTFCSTSNYSERRNQCSFRVMI